MLLSLIKSNTVPVTVQRGPNKIVFNAALEKISFEDKEYVELRQREYTTRIDITEAEGRITHLLSADTFARLLMEEDAVTEDAVAKSKVHVATLEKRHQKRLQAWQDEIKAANDAKDAKEAELRDVRIDRLVWLCPSWDVTTMDGENEVPLPLTRENVKQLSPVFVVQCIEAVEGAVLGPLVPSGSSDA